MQVPLIPRTDSMKCSCYSRVACPVHQMHPTPIHHPIPAPLLAAFGDPPTLHCSFNGSWGLKKRTPGLRAGGWCPSNERASVRKTISWMGESPFASVQTGEDSSLGLGRGLGGIGQNPRIGYSPRPPRPRLLPFKVSGHDRKSPCATTSLSSFQSSRIHLS